MKNSKIALICKQNLSIYNIHSMVLCQTHIVPGVKITMYLLLPVTRHGRLVARHPVLTIACSFLVTSLTFIGYLNFKWETNAVKLWLPAGSEFVKVG